MCGGAEPHGSLGRRLPGGLPGPEWKREGARRWGALILPRNGGFDSAGPGRLRLWSGQARPEIPSVLDAPSSVAEGGTIPGSLGLLSGTANCHTSNLDWVSKVVALMRVDGDPCPRPRRPDARGSLRAGPSRLRCDGSQAQAGRVSPVVTHGGAQSHCPFNTAHLPGTGLALCAGPVPVPSHCSLVPGRDRGCSAPSVLLPWLSLHFCSRSKEYFVMPSS